MEYTGKKILLIRMDDDHGRDLHVVPSMTIGTSEWTKARWGLEDLLSKNEVNRRVSM